MRNLAKNTTYIIEIERAKDLFNWYHKISNAYKITNGERIYFNLDNERVQYETGSKQLAKEFLNSMGFNTPIHLSSAQNVVLFTTETTYKQLKK